MLKVILLAILRLTKSLKKYNSSRSCSMEPVTLLTGFFIYFVKRTVQLLNIANQNYYFHRQL